jgi:hypothetical protein
MCIIPDYVPTAQHGAASGIDRGGWLCGHCVSHCSVPAII